GAERVDGHRSPLPLLPPQRRYHYPPPPLGAPRARRRRLRARQTDPAPRDNHLPAWLRDGDVSVLPVGCNTNTAERDGLGQDRLSNRARPPARRAAANRDRLHLRWLADAENESEAADPDHRDAALRLLVRDDAHHC